MNPKNLIAALAIASLSVVLAGCGSAQSGANQASNPVPEIFPIVGTASYDGVVVKSRAILNVSNETPSLAKTFLSQVFPQAYAASGTQTVTVVNSANSSITLNSVGFAVPTIKNALLNFGTLSTASLFDNNLKVCGSGSNKKCGTALIRIYTTGTAGAGMWNTVDGYGMPITAALTGTPPSGSVGLNTDGAVTLQSISIASNKNTVSLSDFGKSTTYDIKSDFTTAGVGSYSTTLVIEYGLTL